MQQPPDEPDATNQAHGNDPQGARDNVHRAQEGSRRRYPPTMTLSSNSKRWHPNRFLADREPSSSSQSSTGSQPGPQPDISFSEPTTLREPAIYIVSQILRNRMTLFLAPDQSDDILRNSPAVTSIN
ncbi:unnamed protein product [Anisakis simplex]|uniref:Uncharacterized protein n=1 Tax=Anisakis simplex TaxID=6269 RepID=A0A0M3JUH1_ANISI|nr:unnamed protein product [Anisakis simplex]